MVRLVMLGTGHAMVTKCYNTCFAIESDKGTVMVDAGGYLTGSIWVLRKINSLMKHSRYDGFFKIYGHAENLNYIKNSCEFLLNDTLSDNIQFIPICGKDKLTECGIDFEVIDINSTKKEQFGFRAVIRNHDKELVMVCLGDEPCYATSEIYVKNADWLLSEAFCLRSEEELFHPYEKNHSTAWE